MMRDTDLNWEIRQWPACSIGKQPNQYLFLTKLTDISKATLAWEAQHTMRSKAAGKNIWSWTRPPYKKDENLGIENISTTIQDVSNKAHPYQHQRIYKLRYGYMPDLCSKWIMYQLGMDHFLKALPALKWLVTDVRNKELLNISKNNGLSSRNNEYMKTSIWYKIRAY